MKSIKINGKIKKSKKITKTLLKKHKIVIIVTDHDKFNYNIIKNTSQYLFDCRNSVKGRKKNYYSV